MATKIILFATPFFFLLIAIELYFNKKRNAGVYRTNDAIMSLSLGVISQTKKLVVFSFATLVYAFVSDYFAIVQLSDNSIAVWIFSFVLYDFLYYWFHRFSHQINFLWAGHVVHHQSEEYNLTTALRQTSSSVMAWLFYIPSFMLGIPAEVFFVSGALNLIYQYWVHTQLIGKLGWFESIFVTPSHHRVHHGRNALYIDKNHGGVFIIWDRVFGTFQEELESVKVIYGVRPPVNSFNPLWANLHTWYSLLIDAVRAKSWFDKFRIWFMPTGWRPLDVINKYPRIKQKANKQVKYDPKSTSLEKAFAIYQYTICVFFAVYFIQQPLSMTLIDTALFWVMITIPLVSGGLFTEGNSFAQGFESVRLLISFALLIYYFETLLTWQFYSIFTYLAISTFFLIAMILSKNTSNISMGENS